MPLLTFAQGDFMKQSQNQDLPLSPRMIQIMQLVIEGHCAKTIARKLGTQVKTVQVQRALAKQRLGALNCVHAAILFERSKKHWARVLAENPFDERRSEVGKRAMAASRAKPALTAQAA